MEHLKKCIAYTDPNSSTSEAIKCLRTNTLFLNTGKNFNILGFTSSVPSEGKTFVVTNFSITIARSNKKTLFIDGDIRRCEATQQLDFDGQPGLSDILKSGISSYEDIPIYPTEMDNLFILPAGTIREHPAELLESDNFSRLLAHVKERFDIVCIDTPPVLVVADSIIISKKVDGLIFIVMANKTLPSQVERAWNQLQDSRVNILGSVLNKADTGAQRYRYNYGYYYSYKNKKKTRG